ncbi:CRISPR-associated protein Cas4 [Hydrogenibacillus sp. N12]|uniref:CRISPR-associated protein Cas4 n=1 Tax=Hydrogenibacillus sp. N12 TaxID=2866627 RepID=UPI001C7CEA3A|nr:CRISPR-associated protein Cas4 [Hydrogenibacillus sp. N12]QZA32476.1 CRISPR-associated protein Cas4 [Hydrogenibacillus sp. N12]
MHEPYSEVTPLTGSLLYHWVVCSRSAWLYSRQITPDRDHGNLSLGRWIAKTAYPRKGAREVSLPGAKIDVLDTDGDAVIVVEVKKSSRMVKGARLQVLFYLWRLKEHGISARGEIRVPKERKRLDVFLDGEGEAHLLASIRALGEVLARPSPPPAAWIPSCRSCAFLEFCWVDEPEHPAPETEDPAPEVQEA